MSTRSLTLLLILCSLLLSLPALAGDAPRRVTTAAGQVLEGIVVERSSAHLVLQLEDGRMIELLRDQIETIEVLPDRGRVGNDDDDDDEDWADERPSRSRYYRPLNDATEYGQPGVHLDGLDRDLLKERLGDATVGHALSIAPMVPSMAGGAVLMVSSPLISGYYLWPGQFVAGMVLAGGSVVSAAGGAHMAAVAAGLTEPSERFKGGLVMSIAGASMFVVPLGLTYGSTTGFLPTTGIEGTVAPILIGSGLGTLIAGNVILAADADFSREAIERRLEKGEFAGEPRRVRPQFAGMSFGPGLDGGLHGSVSLRF